MQAICSFSVPKTIKTKDMGATMFIMKGFVLNIHNHNQLVATVPRGLTLMVLADSPVSCKSNFDLFAFFKDKIGPQQDEKIQNKKVDLFEFQIKKW